MSRRTVDLRGSQRPLLDIRSHGRRGSTPQTSLSPAIIAHASRTVRGAPEVMIRVTGGARTIRGVATHLDYIEKHADLQTDDGAVLAEKGFGAQFLTDWDLELDAGRRHTQRAVAAGRRPPKLVHNLVFSMPKGTPAEKVEAAVRKFALEKFALQHRYAMALHTHQGNPHVHVVVKAVSEQGERLNIRKATLRQWHSDFARNLRELGVEANATERAVRGSGREDRRPALYWAARRGDSRVLRERAESVARGIRQHALARESGKATLAQTRQAVRAGWLGFAEVINREGLHELADQVRRFVERMPPPRTDRETIAVKLIAGIQQARERAPPSR